MRRYEVAWVRRKAPGRALPRSHLQADLDFVSSSSTAKSASEAALCEAEVLKAVVEVLEQLPEVPLFEVRLGHRAVLEAVLHYIGIAQVRILQVLQSSSAAGTHMQRCIFAVTNQVRHMYLAKVMFPSHCCHKQRRKSI